MAKPALGRGLGALLGGSPVAKPPGQSSIPAAVSAESGASVHGERVDRIPIDRIHPCPFQPRKDFSAESLKELADSIREQGIVQPLIVRHVGGRTELIAGERRWRAAQAVGLKEVPVIYRHADDRAVLELALIENLQRENLNPIEEALGYGQLIDQFSLTQEQVAAKVGKSRAVVANSLRLLKLPLSVQAHVREGRLSVGHAKVVLGLATPRHQEMAAERILAGGLNVRQTEVLVARLQPPATVDGTRSTPAGATPRDPHTVELENQIRERLGTKVHLRYAQGKGALEVLFYSDDELERIMEILGVRVD